jgi:hypothetical protein
MKSRMTRKLLALAVAVTAALVAVPAAQAGPLVASATDCAEQSLDQVFLPWADPMHYTLNPGGDFENGAPGWTLNGAGVVDGNERFDVTSDDDRNSLNIPAGGSATSAAICVGIEHPTIRFFTKGAVLGSSTLGVEVLFEDAFGNVHSLPVGTVTPTSTWQPTLPYPVVANLLPLLPGERTAVSFRFTAIGGSVRIDDVYVDPYKTR